MDIPFELQMLIATDEENKYKDCSYNPYCTFPGTAGTASDYIKSICITILTNAKYALAT